MIILAFIMVAAIYVVSMSKKTIKDMDELNKRFTDYADKAESLQQEMFEELVRLSNIDRGSK